MVPCSLTFDHSTLGLLEWLSQRKSGILCVVPVILFALEESRDTKYERGTICMRIIDERTLARIFSSVASHWYSGFTVRVR